MYTLVPIPKLTQTDMHDRLVLRDLSRRQFVSSVVRKLSHACPPQFFRRTGNRAATRAQRHTVSSASFSSLAYVDRTGPQSGQPFNQCRCSLFWHRYSVLEKIPVLREASRDIDRSEAAVFVRSLYPIDSPRLLLVNGETSLFGYVYCLVYLVIGRNSQDFEQVCCFSNFKFQFSLFISFIISLAKRGVNFFK